MEFVIFAALFAFGMGFQAHKEADEREEARSTKTIEVEVDTMVPVKTAVPVEIRVGEEE